ncbi:sulfatase family protein [Membranihabitans marinus]|uniref:sulfatase family protein n=1 Tax=Membranihabitans marinus TaxID=1227546 RepID=UPI001F409154|nr:sulfatase [Membranihabitans marinus]
MKLQFIKMVVKKELFYSIILFTVILGHGLQAQSSSRPNIVFIMSDDHTSQSWGIYGGILKDYVQNKNISRLAEEGAVLRNAFCTNSICVPSRASILTGQYSHDNKVFTLQDSLNPHHDNIAKVLQEAGYQTGLFGKWHLKSQPMGFDDYMVLPGQGIYHDPYFRGRDYWENNQKNLIQKKGFSTDVITQMSLDWLDDRKTDQPFFLMCHFKATHEPFDYAHRFETLYQDVDIPTPDNLYDVGPSSTNRVFTGHSMDILGQRYEQASTGDFWAKYPGLPFSTENLSADSARYQIYQKFIKDFMRSGAGIDENIGHILDYLDDRGLTENTIVIYTSDQGYFLGEHGFFDKRMMLEESLRMPFVIRYPKEIKGGSEVNDIILNIDFPALMADYAGLEKPSFIAGQSFREQLKGESVKDWRNHMYYRYWTHSPTRPAHYGLRTERYKLIYYYGRPMNNAGPQSEWTSPGWELYDLEKDPFENQNVYKEKKYRKIRQKLHKDLQQAMADAGDQYDIKK